MEPDPEPVDTGRPTKATVFIIIMEKNGDVFCHRKGNKTPADLKSLNLPS